ncbi:MAG: 2,4-dihydroxyhept-2-ene-1,7-dioic acid aldolase [Mameliella sp.]|nr:2,4-dihydroxyhept-2-ene-1,7-dioic acid aldolase [Mameliella sp.]|tara:strand:+ start:5280 stop:5981 length:702 start_codon:yes stop_codon:yes gene_type:complete
MTGTNIREKLKRGEVVKMINPHHVSDSLAGRLISHGADAVFLDCEHGSWSLEDVRSTTATVGQAGGTAIVRPNSHERSQIIRYTNIGAHGLMVPMVDNAKEASAIVDAVRYGNPHDYEKVLVICMIEDVNTVERELDEMLAVDGVDVFFFGPTDLSQSLGLLPPLPGEDWDPRIKDTIKSALGRVTESGKLGGTLVRESNVKEFVDAGATFLYLHADPFLKAGFEKFDRALVV